MFLKVSTYYFINLLEKCFHAISKESRDGQATPKLEKLKPQHLTLSLKVGLGQKKMQF